MKIETLQIGMNVRHPQYGTGVVKSVGESTAEILFNDGKRVVAPEASDLQPAEPQASIKSPELPLSQVLGQTAEPLTATRGRGARVSSW